MLLLFLLPGVIEWLFIIFVLVTFFLAIPILAIVFYNQKKSLLRQLSQLTLERNDLMNRLQQKK